MIDGGGDGLIASIGSSSSWVRSKWLLSSYGVSPLVGLSLFEGGGVRKFVCICGCKSDHWGMMPDVCQAADIWIEFNVIWELSGGIVRPLVLCWRNGKKFWFWAGGWGGFVSNHDFAFSCRSSLKEILLSRLKIPAWMGILPFVISIKVFQISFSTAQTCGWWIWPCSIQN